MGTRAALALAALAASALTAGIDRAASGAGAPVVPERPLRTAFLPNAVDAGIARRVRTAGARVVRVPISWSAVAPVAERRPGNFVATDPDSSLYRWGAVDRRIRTLHNAGVQVLLGIASAPVWAQGEGHRSGGTFRPRPEDLADFAYAAALRYSGRTRGLPRVRYWQAWNEPNLPHYLSPQVVAGRPVSASWYRSMVNAFARGVKRVHRGNLVIAGGLAPLGRVASVSVRPLEFMRAMLCVSRTGKRTCRARARFDVWSHHPYTTGGPQHRTFNRDDVGLGELPRMRNLLMTAYRLGTIEAPRTPEFWVTEFSWDSKPPDPRGVPLDLHARWVSEALYRMWVSGVSLVTWFLLEDEPVKASPFQSGLYFSGFRPKPALQAFRFPFVAFREPGGWVRVWGRTPGSDRRTVVIEQSAAGRWRRVTVLTADRFGIFTSRLRTSARGPVRATLTRGGRSGEASRTFSLVVPPDRFVRPFG